MIGKLLLFSSLFLMFFFTEAHAKSMLCDQAQEKAVSSNFVFEKQKTIRSGLISHIYFTKEKNALSIVCESKVVSNIGIHHIHVPGLFNKDMLQIYRVSSEIFAIGESDIRDAIARCSKAILNREVNFLTDSKIKTEKLTISCTKEVKQSDEYFQFFILNLR